MFTDMLMLVYFLRTPIIRKTQNGAQSGEKAPVYFKFINNWSRRCFQLRWHFSVYESTCAALMCAVNTCRHHFIGLLLWRNNRSKYGVVCLCACVPLTLLKGPYFGFNNIAYVLLTIKTFMCICIYSKLYIFTLSFRATGSFLMYIWLMASNDQSFRLIPMHLDFSWPNYLFCLDTNLRVRIMASCLTELVICGEIRTKLFILVGKCVVLC